MRKHEVFEFRELALTDRAGEFVRAHGRRSQIRSVEMSPLVAAFWLSWYRMEHRHGNKWLRPAAIT